MSKDEMTKDEIILANKEYLFPAVFHYYKEPLVVSHAKNQYVWDADGNQYLDFFGGIVTVSVGHCNEQVNAKVHRQMDKLQHVSTVFANEPQAALAKKIASITPEGKLTKSFFTNSGTEANETAITVARCYTGSSEIVALRHSYHGRSALAMTLTAHSSWRLGGVPQAGIVHAHNAYCYRCPFGLTYPDCNVKCAQDVEDLIRTTTSGRIAGLKSVPFVNATGVSTVCTTVSYGMPSTSATSRSFRVWSVVHAVPRPRARAASMKLHMAGRMLPIAEAWTSEGWPSKRPSVHPMTRTGASPMCSPR
jgi:4-aminobutyrate aminotransferase